MGNQENLLENAKYYLEKKLKNISNLANLAAYLFNNLKDVNWVGFYLFDGSDLYVGPYQGKPACSNIQIGTGVCGTSALKRETIVVRNVHDFDGHIACDSESISEIVIPIIAKSGELFGVLDIDSPIENRFNNNIKKSLENIVNLLVDIL